MCWKLRANLPAGAICLTMLMDEQRQFERLQLYSKIYVSLFVVTILHVLHVDMLLVIQPVGLLLGL